MKLGVKVKVTASGSAQLAVDQEESKGKEAARDQASAKQETGLLKGDILDLLLLHHDLLLGK